jgi:hypothetical protein
MCNELGAVVSKSVVNRNICIVRNVHGTGLEVEEERNSRNR